MKRLFSLFSFCLLSLAIAQAQLPDTFDDRMPRPLGETLNRVEKMFGVRFKYEIDTTGMVINFANSRIRPYSLEETLQNILAPFDLKAWQQGNPKLYKVRGYEHCRRYDSDGEKLLSWIQSQITDSAAWAQRRQMLRREARERLGLQPLLDQCVPLRPILGKVRRYDGYTVQNIALETLPGFYVCGTIYAPSAKGKHGVIICPNGHFKDGRYREDQQQRMGVLARMGAICIDFDSFAYGENLLQLQATEPQQTPVQLHEHAMAMVLQVLSGERLLDYALTRKDVDPTRIGANGGSGGGTHAMLLTLVDDRFTASCPVVSICSHFDGGCPCESGIPIHRGELADGTFLSSCNIELGATFAPKPMMIVGDEGDWTHTYPTLEIPFVERIYGFYEGKESNFQHVFLPGERHDFGPNKRQAVYDFFADVWNLDKSKLDESKVTIEPYENLYSFGNDASKLPAGAIRSIDELYRFFK